jgi:hypothetical protein
VDGWLRSIWNTNSARPMCRQQWCLPICF